MTILLSIAVIALFVGGFICMEISIHRDVFGKLIPEEGLDVFLTKHLDNYEINECANKMFWNKDLPYISYSNSFHTNWYINDYGCISKRSKWNKILNEKYKILEKKLPKKSLKDLCQQTTE